jgi:hypothetical protein
MSAAAEERKLKAAAISSRQHSALNWYLCSLVAPVLVLTSFFLSFAEAHGAVVTDIFSIAVIAILQFSVMISPSTSF